MGDFTYEHLFDVLRRERSREELQRLEPGFYADAEDFIARQAEVARNADVLSKDGEHARTQLQNARKLLREVYDRREKKMVLLALNKARTGSAIIDTSALLDSERVLYEALVDVLLSSRKARATPVVRAPPARPPPARPPPVSKEPAPQPAAPGSEVRVRILVDMPRFLGGAEESFGPFTAGAETTLPARVAAILVKKGRAEVRDSPQSL